MSILDKISKTKKPRATKATKKAATATLEVQKAGVNSVVSQRVLVRPLVSEKSATASANNVYSFVVGLTTDKVQIARAIQTIYGVKPAAIRTVRVKGKFKRHGRSEGKRSDWKKALVTLPAGKSITIHEGV